LPNPYLNLGCGRLILPMQNNPIGNLIPVGDGFYKPAHHALVESALYKYPFWLNIDRNTQPGVDRTMDLFTYPWDLPDNAYDGALLTHLIEHIPHEIEPAKQTWIVNNGVGTTYKLPEYFRARQELKAMYQDGWMAFFHNLYRVLTPGAKVHILSPYAWSQGAVTDFSHTRLITEHTFTHSMQPDENSPFEYATGGINFKFLGVQFTPTEMSQTFLVHEGDSEQTQGWKRNHFMDDFQRKLNTVYEVYCQLEVVK